MPEFSLEMNFKPIIDWFRLQGHFCLLHWQAKPFGQRRWGIYENGSGSYTSLKHRELNVEVTPQLLQVDENLIKTVPTAVMLFANSKLIKNGYYSITSI